MTSDLFTANPPKTPCEEWMSTYYIEIIERNPQAVRDGPQFCACTTERAAKKMVGHGATEIEALVNLAMLNCLPLWKS